MLIRWKIERRISYFSMLTKILKAKFLIFQWRRKLERRISYFFMLTKIPKVKFLIFQWRRKFERRISYFPMLRGCLNICGEIFKGEISYAKKRRGEKFLIFASTKKGEAKKILSKKICIHAELFFDETFTNFPKDLFPWKRISTVLSRLTFFFGGSHNNTMQQVKC